MTTYVCQRPVGRGRRLGAAPLVSLLALLVASGACERRERERPVLPRSQTWAELRTVRRAVTVQPPGEPERAPYPRERMVDGEVVHVADAGLAWLRRDGGATLLVQGPADLTLLSESVEVRKGRVFIDTPGGAPAELTTPAGKLHLAHVRASLSIEGSRTEAYVLSGEVRTDATAPAAPAKGEPTLGAGSVKAGPGERLVVEGDHATLAPALAWEDWTGGLATTDRVAEPSPYGVGTVGARKPGEQGVPGFPLAIQKLDVRVTIDHDLAITEVDELFFNPSSEVVEGVYRFRTPDGATLHRFGVDRDGVTVWGRVKEKAAAAAQYQANVYQGSTEDPALLEWDAPGVYRARLYPIGPGETRRVVVRYAEWLGRTGAKGERRLYVYPMAAEGAEASLPHIEELTARVHLAAAGAKEVRVGMAGAREDDDLVIRAHDLVPRADLSVELFDDGLPAMRGYIAPHTVDTENLPPSQRAQAMRRAEGEEEYVLVPLRAADVPLAEGGLDLAIVVDTSAATEPASLAIARAATAALLAHLGKDDRVGVWAGDSSLRPVVAGQDQLTKVDEAARRAILTGLATTERGGATDLGNMLSEAAQKLDPKRRGAVVYIGDGAPTVGELDLHDLRDKLAKLPRPVRVFGLGVGDGAAMATLKGLARGALAERITDANGAARAALRLLEESERPAWLGAGVDLGSHIDHVVPRDLSAMVADESVLVVGRLAPGTQPPTSVEVTGPNGKVTLPITTTRLDDKGDMRRRWADGQLAQMIDEGTGRAAMVDLGSRHGIITPVTSLYVPTKNEMTPEERADLERKVADTKARELEQESVLAKTGKSRNGAQDREYEKASNQLQADAKEGGTGTRAKGEEGSMGNPNRRDSGNRYGIAGPGAKADDAAPMASAATAAAASAPPAAMPPAAPADLDQAKGGLASIGNAGPYKQSPPPPPKSPEPMAKPMPQFAARGQARAGAAGKAVTATTEAAPAEKGEKKAEKPASAGDSPTPASARQEALKDAAEFGMIGLSNSSADPTSARGNMWGNEIGEAFGAGGLGLSGIGEGGGGQTDGIGLGAIGTIGHGSGATGGEVDQGFGSGHGRLGGPAANHKAKRKNEVDKLDKRADGKKVADERTRSKIGDEGPAAIAIGVRVDVPHAAFRCGGAAFVPFDERVVLWRERLGGASGNAQAAAGIYRRALAQCEAPTWRERSKLLSMLLDAMPQVSQKVALWRVMFNDLGAADSLYRGILARVRTPEEARQLHQALGLRAFDPTLLEKMLKDAKSPEDRVKKLRELVRSWPDDFALSLRLLDMLEDLGDDAAGRELAKKLRARPDADARLRTAVGEFYLRAAGRDADAAKKADDTADAKRAFGEIVEFAPDDPVARRRLGDLLRAHGWFAEAERQYQTLAKLAPDDPSVALLLAAADEGLGRLEEAVKWTEKGGAAGAPDVAQGPAVTARAIASTYLAWGLEKAVREKKDDEVKAIDARLARVLATERTDKKALRGPRATLTWTHPELHPTLWSNALGSPMPAPEGDVTLGVAQVLLPPRPDAFVEVRIEKDELAHAARLGAEAVLTALFEDGDKPPKIVRLPIHFDKDGPATQRFSLADGEVSAVKP